MNPNQNQEPNQNQPQQTQEPGQTRQPVQPVVPPVDPAFFEKHDYTHPIVDPPKHIYHPKRFKLLLGAFVGICILAVAIMLLVALLPPTGPKLAQNTERKGQPTSTPKPLTATLAMTHIKGVFAGTEQPTSPLLYPVQAPNMAYFTVIPDVAPLVGVAGEVTPAKASAQLSAITKSLKGDKLTGNVVTDGTNDTNYQAYFTNSTVICEVDQVNSAAVNVNVHIEAKCLDIATYAAYAAAQQPLVSLYTPLSATSVQYAFVGKPAPTVASTAGYKRAQLQVSSVISNQMTSMGQFALYYQTPDGLWHYFTDQDNNVAIDCTKFNNNDLLSAYSGTPCQNLNKGTASTVPAPRKN